MCLSPATARGGPPLPERAEAPTAAAYTHERTHTAEIIGSSRIYFRSSKNQTPCQEKNRHAVERRTGRVSTKRAGMNATRCRQHNKAEERKNPTKNRQKKAEKKEGNGQATNKQHRATGHNKKQTENNEICCTGLFDYS